MPVGPVTDLVITTGMSFKSSATPEMIPKRFKMLDIPEYDGTSDLQEHITTYTIVVKGNNLAQHEIESVLLKSLVKPSQRGL